VLHRDVKLENILLDFAGDVKLADFGCSVIDFYDKGRETFCGTVDCKNQHAAVGIFVLFFSFAINTSTLVLFLLKLRLESGNTTSEEIRNTSRCMGSWCFIL